MFHMAVWVHIKIMVQTKWQVGRFDKEADHCNSIVGCKMVDLEYT